MDEMKKSVMFDFEEGNDVYSINVDSIELQLKIKNLFRDGSNDILVQIL